MTEVNFSKHVLQNTTCTIDDSDMQLVGNLQKEALLFYATYHDFSWNSSGFMREFKELCVKYGVDYLRSEDRAAFAKALMGMG